MSLRLHLQPIPRQPNRETADQWYDSDSPEGEASTITAAFTCLPALKSLSGMRRGAMCSNRCSRGGIAVSIGMHLDIGRQKLTRCGVSGAKLFGWGKEVAGGLATHRH
jgi:hypothetical protein